MLARAYRRSRKDHARLDGWIASLPTRWFVPACNLSPAARSIGRRQGYKSIRTTQALHLQSLPPQHTLKMLSHLLPLALSASAVLACEGGCYGAPTSDIVLTRHVRRMQPDAQNATTGPRGPLEWGQINFLHTTDTHGWLEGHIKERNYGADWGDYASFVKGMRRRAHGMFVSLVRLWS